MQKQLDVIVEGLMVAVLDGRFNGVCLGRFD
jgi:hypothetical protein